MSPRFKGAPLRPDYVNLIQCWLIHNRAFYYFSAYPMEKQSDGAEGGLEAAGSAFLLPVRK